MRPPEASGGSRITEIYSSDAEISKDYAEKVSIRASSAGDPDREPDSPCGKDAILLSKEIWNVGIGLEKPFGRRMALDIDAEQ